MGTRITKAREKFIASYTEWQDRRSFQEHRSNASKQERLKGMIAGLVLTIALLIGVLYVNSATVGRNMQKMDDMREGKMLDQAAVIGLTSTIDRKDHDIARVVGWYRTLENMAKVDQIFEAMQEDSVKDLEQKVKEAEAWLKSQKEKEKKDDRK